MSAGQAVRFSTEVRLPPTSDQDRNRGWTSGRGQRFHQDFFFDESPLARDSCFTSSMSSERVRWGLMRRKALRRSRVS